MKEITVVFNFGSFLVTHQPLISQILTFWYYDQAFWYKIWPWFQFWNTQNTQTTLVPAAGWVKFGYQIYKHLWTWIQHICKNLFQWRIRVPKTSLARWHCQPESFCASVKFSRVSTKLPKKCSPNINWRLNKCWKFPDCLKSFRTVWKLSERSWKLPDRLENFQTVWKVFGQFPDGPESCMLRFTHFWRIFVAKASYALLAHICRKNDLGTLSGKFLQMKFC